MGETLAALAEVYGERYYADYGTGRHGYGRESPIPALMTSVAQSLRERWPASHEILDVGCAYGYLVEALRRHGREAWGIDCSPWALDHASPWVRPYLSIEDIGAWQPARQWDLAVCIEVLEHVPESQADHAVGALCAAAKDGIVFSSPRDFDAPDHVNLKPEAYWLGLFERHGWKKTDMAPYVAAWAIELEPR